jgi:hypothetical protein
VVEGEEPGNKHKFVAGKAIDVECRQSKRGGAIAGGRVGRGAGKFK